MSVNPLPPSEKIVFETCNCRLCGGFSSGWCEVQGVVYQRCATCGMIQMQQGGLPSKVQEKECYDWHRNDPGDAGYRAFLDRLATPLCARLAPGASGLDYGCGPGPTLSLMLTERGHQTLCYDPVYFPDCHLLDGRYDFITCTEVAEHFHQPGTEFQRLHHMLEPGGVLAIMTTWYDDSITFASWHYRRDPTHVCFYRRETFAWLAQQLNMRWEQPAPNVVFLWR